MQADCWDRWSILKALVVAVGLVTGVAGQDHGDQGFQITPLIPCQPSTVTWDSDSAGSTLVLTGAQSDLSIPYTLKFILPTEEQSGAFNFTLNFARGNGVIEASLISPGSPNSGTRALRTFPSSDTSCVMAASSFPPAAGVIDTGNPPNFDPSQSPTLQQCQPSQITWTGGTPPFHLMVTSGASNQDPLSIASSFELDGLQESGINITLPFTGSTQWVVTDSQERSSPPALFTVGSSGNANCLVFTTDESTSNNNTSSTSITTTQATGTTNNPFPFPFPSHTTGPTTTTSPNASGATPSAVVIPASASISKSSISKASIIGAVVGSILGLLLILAIGAFVYYHRRHIREQEMKAEVSYVPPQHAKLIDVKVKPPELE